MSKFKRTFSALLALVMAFSVMTVAFTVTGSAAPTETRTAATNPSAVFTVPQYLSSYGSNINDRGTNLKCDGSVFLQVKGATDVMLTCSEAGVAYSDYTQGTDSYSWKVTGGTLNTAPNANSVVKWTAKYKVNGKAYETVAWSHIKMAYGNPGFATRLKNNNFWASHETENMHVEQIEPLYGNYVGDTQTGYNANIDLDSGSYSSATGALAGGYYWNRSDSKNSSQDWTSPVTVSGTYFVDSSKYSNLSDTPIVLKAKLATWRDTDSNHPEYYLGPELQSPTINGSTVSGYSATNSGSDSSKVGGSEIKSDTFAGAIPAAGSTLNFTVKSKWEGNVSGAVSSRLRSYCMYNINVVSYDKSALANTLARATAGNYQQAQFRTAKPTDGKNYTNFKSWNDYYTALQTAWTVYGRQDVTQNQIDAANSTLSACLPVYSGSDWASGMMYAEADYKAIDNIMLSIPDDFLEVTYSDGTYGQHYKRSLAAAVIDAIADIEYDRPLDARYQVTVDRMKQKLAETIDGLLVVDGSQYKDLTVRFNANTTDSVTGMPGDKTATLYGAVTAPTAPTRTNYEFTGWYYDAACSEKVNFPFSASLSNKHFAGNLNTKVDNMGVAFNLYAGWNLTGRTLTFVTNGDTTMEPVVGSAGQAYAGPSITPLKAGYNFVCWCSDATLQNPVDWSTFTFGSLDKVYGKWQRASFTVTFYANGGKFQNGSDSLVKSYLYNATIAEPESPSRANYGFVGWYFDAACTQPVDFMNFTMPSEAIMVYAKWSTAVRNITFQANNGETPIVNSYNVGSQVSAPSKPSRDGYDFVDWYYNATLTSKVTFPITVGNDNLTLYAKWTPKKINVYFDPGEGDMAPSFVVGDYLGLDCGAVLVEPEMPNRAGYVFVCWTVGGADYTFSTVPTKDTTFVAKWEVEPFTTRFRLRTDVTGALSQGDVINATVSMYSNHIVSNHSFIVYYDSRYLQPAMNNAPYTSVPTSPALACNKTAGKAYFTICKNPGGNVTDCGNATGRVNQNGQPIARYFPPEWYTGTGSTAALKPEYAHYEYVYFAVADSPSGTRMMPSVEQDLATFQFIVRDDAPLADGINEYAQLLMPADYVKNSATAPGQISACRETQLAYDTASLWDTRYVLLGNDQRFAVEEMVTSRINFDTNSNTTVSAMVEKVGKIVTLPTPVKTNYTFAGWTLSPDDDDLNFVDAKAFVVPDHNITLYAKWTGKSATYYVRHYKQDITASGWMTTYDQDRLTAQIGTVVTAQPKTYVGFTCATTDSKMIEGDTENPTILTLYYTRNQSTVTLNANGGIFGDNSTTHKLTGLFEAPLSNPYGDPTRTGYTFNGWASGATAVTLSTFPAQDATYNASWTANTYTMNFYLNGSTSPYTTITASYGDAITAPTVTVGTGMAFSGWKNESGEPFNYTTMPAYDEDFFGTTGFDGYTVTRYVDGVQYGAPLSLTRGTQLYENMVAYTPPTGYSFSGWRLTNSVAGARATFPMNLTENVVLYGFNSKNLYTITLNYSIDGAPMEYFASVTGYYGDAFTLPEVDDYSDYGYTFNGWYTDEAMTKKYIKPSKMQATDLQLYGAYDMMTGTVSFNLNGGTGTAPADIEEAIGETVTLPGGNGITKQYYKFGGWALNPTSKTPVRTVDIVDTETVTVYAIWLDNYATVSFNTNGAEAGATPESVKVEVGSALTNLPTGADLTREGFQFIGWAESETATEAISSLSITATGSKTLYAVWMALNVELIPAEGSSTIIDTENGVIYGLDFNMGEAELMDYLAVDGNGHLEVQYDAYIGTGAKVELINDNTGNVDAVYYLVIFGDVNGDGIANATDVTMIRGNISGALVMDASDPVEAAKLMACDLNGDGLVNATDVVYVRSMLAGSLDLDQTTRTVL